jgi:hypothetical protein
MPSVQSATPRRRSATATVRASEVVSPVWSQEEMPVVQLSTLRS